MVLLKSQRNYHMVFPSVNVLLRNPKIEKFNQLLVFYIQQDINIIVMKLENYHSEENMIPNIQDDISYLNPLDLDIINNISFNSKFRGQNLTKEKFQLYLDRFYASQNLYFQYLYFSFLQYSNYSKSELNRMSTKLIHTIPKLIFKLLSVDFCIDDIFIIDVYQNYINLGYRIHKWQEIYNESIKIAKIKPEFKNCLCFKIILNLVQVPYNIRKNIIIPQDFFDLILVWISNHDGNTTLHIFDTLNKIFTFLRQHNKESIITQIKTIISPKMIKFIDKLIIDANLDNDNAQHLMLKRHFLHQKLKIIREYSLDKSQLNHVLLEFDQFSKLLPNAPKGYIQMKYISQIDGNDIESILSSFKIMSESQFVNFLVYNENLIPIEPLNKDYYDFVGIFSSEIIRLNGDIKKIIPDPNFSHKNGGLNQSKKWEAYKNEVHVFLLMLDLLFKKFDSKKLKEEVKKQLHKSTVISEVSKQLIYRSFEFFLNGDYVCSINLSIFQIESILKKICNINSLPTRVEVDNKERQSGYTKILEYLKKEQLISKNLLCLIKWVLLDEVDQIGQNLRNKIAHGISDLNTFRSIYNKEMALLLILIYLKLSY